MAKANWLKVDPASGSGNGSVNVTSVSPHTGRTARTTTLTFTAAGVENITRDVSQAGKPEYVDIAENAAANKLGQKVTITGKSNSNKLTFSLGSGSLAVSLPSTYTANSVSTTNGAAISGDPGASAEYSFSISIDVPENTGIVSLSRQVIVTASDGKTDTCTLTLAAGDPYLRVAIGTIELGWEGTTPVAVAIESNTAWEVK